MKAFLAAALCSLLVAAHAPVRAWVIGVDSRTSDQWMAEAPGKVFAIRDSHLVAIDSATGRILWTSSFAAVKAPAVAREALAVPGLGGLAFLDRRDGHVRAIRRDGPDETVAGSESLVAALVPAARAIRGYDAAGRERWSRPYAVTGNTTIGSLGGNLICVQDGYTALFLDASNGKAVASATNVDQLVGADGRYVWFTVAGGGIKGLDLDTDRSFAVHDGIVRDQVRVEHAIAVAVIGGRLNTIDLHAGRVARLPIDGRWIGGPIDGKILVERGDGLYVQSIRAGARAVKVASYASEARFTTSDRDVGYVGLRDGTLLIVDMPGSRLLDRVATGCDFYEGVAASGKTAVVHCDARRQSRLVGFERPGE